MQIDDNADSWLTCIACCILIKFKQYGIMQALKPTTMRKQKCSTLNIYKMFT